MAMNGGMTSEDFCMLLRRATSQLGSAYFIVRVSGAASLYRERVYCYELYHQLRCTWPDSAGFALSGELAKRGNPRAASTRLRNATPDLLVHAPGSDRNLAVVEVKARLPSLEDMQADLEKLAAFQRDLGYDAAFYLIYGLARNRLATLRARALAIADRERSINLAKIQLLIHWQAGTAAQAVSWSGSASSRPRGAR